MKNKKGINIKIKEVLKTTWKGFKFIFWENFFFSRRFKIVVFGFIIILIFILFIRNLIKAAQVTEIL